MLPAQSVINDEIKIENKKAECRARDACQPPKKGILVLKLKLFSNEKDVASGLAS